MNISFYEKVQLATHIERKIANMSIPKEEIKELVYADMGKQLKREFGLSRKRPNLKKKYLCDAHEFVDCYELPRFLEEEIRDCNAQIRMEVSA